MLGADPCAIAAAIDAVLKEDAKRVRGLALRRIKDANDWNAARAASGNQNTPHDATPSEDVPPLVYGILIESPSDVCGLVSFSMAYSTWQGCFILIDELCCKGMDDEMELSLLKVMAKVSVKIGSARLTWRHTTTPEWHSKDIKPEFMNGWLTLCMEKPAVADYAFQVTDDVDLGTPDASFSRSSVEPIISKCLEVINKNEPSPFTLRLASEEDLDTIAKLVQGLADYEKEPDAVEMTIDGYREDGFSSEYPLFYCVLIDNKNEDGSLTTFGMAFVFFGHHVLGGRYMYLEDLFLMEEFRKKGGGSRVMKSLATFGQALGCQRLFWQALDWNAPALSFYDKIGAKVMDGVLTSRFVNPDLKRVAES